MVIPISDLAGPNAEMLQSDFHGSMALLFNSEQSLVYWSFDYSVKFLELPILSRSWEEVATEGTEILISLFHGDLQCWLKISQMLPGVCQ